MKTIIILDTRFLTDTETEDIIQFIIIAEDWESAEIAPHEVSTRLSGSYYLTYIPTEDMLTFYEAADITSLMTEQYRVIQPKDKYDFFRKVLNTNY